MLAYIGTYTKDGGGIHCYRIDRERGVFTEGALVAEAPNPSYLAAASDGKRLYAVLETAEFEGFPGGAVVAYVIDRMGALAELGRRPTTGAYPCHLTLDEAHGVLVAANYGQGTVSVFPLEPGGGIGPLAQVLAHEGSGPDAGRQEGPHAHCVLPTPDGRFILAADLGIDAVLAYRPGPEGRLARDGRASIPMRSGCGPRHLAFRPGGRTLYVVTELSNEVAAFEYRQEEGVFRELCHVPALPAGFRGQSWCAAVRVHPSGHALYVSNRGHDSIAVFRVGESGIPEPAGHVPCGGEWPRDIALSPDGRFLYAACERSDIVTVFSVDGDTGALTPLGVAAETPSPTCVAFV